MRFILLFLILFSNTFLPAQRLIRVNGSGSPSATKVLSATSTASAIATSSYKVGDLIQTKGSYQVGDGGAATYVIESSPSATVDSQYIRPTAGGKYARFLGDEITLKQYGFIADVVDHQTYSLSGNTVTCSTCNFTSADIGKVIYLEKSFSIAAKLETVKIGDFANVTALKAHPSPQNGDIAKVLDSSDWSTKDTLTGVHFFGRRSSSTGFRPYLHITDSWYTITGVNSSTSITIDDTPCPEHTLNNLKGRYGTNNIVLFNKLKALQQETGIDVIVTSGEYMIASQNDIAIISSSFDDGNPSTDSRYRIGWFGVGNPILHTVHIGDTLSTSFASNLTDAINNHVSSFWNFGEVSTGDFVEYVFRDFTIKGQSFTGPRTVDGVTKGAFSFGTGNRRVILDNIKLLGNDGFVYTSGTSELIMDKCYYDGLYSAEVCIQPFGATNLRITNSEFHNNGPRNFYTPDGKGRGRSVYINNNEDSYFNGVKFFNNEGHTIQYFTSGGDVVDTLNISQKFVACDFHYDNGTTAGIGIYSSRTSNNLQIIGCNFQGTNGSTLNAINSAGGVSIANSVFDRATITNSFGVGTNNVFRDRDEAKVRYTDCNFFNSPITLSALSASGVNFTTDFDNCYFYRDSTIDYNIRTIGENPSNLHRANFFSCDFEGHVLTGQSGFRFAPRMLFFETGNNCHLYFEGASFNQHSDPNTNLVVLANTIRDSVTLEFVNCSSSLDSVYLEISGKPASILGSNNQFKTLLIDNNADSTNHALGFGLGLSPDTLTAASFLDCNRNFSYGEYIVSGSTAIDRIFIPVGRDNHEGKVMSGDFTLHFLDALTLNTGDNIDIASNLAVAANSRLKCRYDNKVQKVKILEVNTP